MRINVEQWKQQQQQQQQQQQEQEQEQQLQLFDSCTGADSARGVVRKRNAMLD